jgi:hypothetical protein
MSDFPGITEWDNPNGIHIFRLHYTADPEKGEGEKQFVEDENLWLSPWAKKQYDGFTSKRSFFQEIDIDFSAKSGALIYQLEDRATLEPLSALPADGTDYYFLDPHPRVPHAHLWIRVDRWGDAWAFRELWPSKIYGQPGSTPEDDNRYRIRDYIETVKYVESAEHPKNHGKALNIYKRVIDYAARGFYGTTDDEDQRSVQRRYEEESQKVGYPLTFADAIKDVDAGIEAVNEWLKPRLVEGADGAFSGKSRLHIVESECPELIWELRNNRFENLTPVMLEKRDPSPKPIAKRNHLTDLLKYACLCGLDYVRPTKKGISTWKPLHPGVAY